MFNAIRMDVYRLFRTKSSYIILIIMIAFSVLGTGLTSLMYGMVDTSKTSVETTEISEMVDDTQTKEGMSTDTEQENVGFSVEASDAVDDIYTGETSVLEMVMSDVSGLQVGLFIIIFTVLFSMADINSGFIKSIGGQVKGRGILICSKIAAIAVYTAIVMIIEVVTQTIATFAFFDNAEFGDVSKMLELCASQYVLNLALAIFIMAIAIIIKNNVVSMIIGVCLCTGIFQLMFMGLNYLIEKIGIDDFDINNILITSKIQSVTIGADSADIGYALLTALIYIVVSVIAVYNVFKHRDI